MKVLDFLVGVSCVIVSTCGVLYIKEKIDDERRIRETVQRGPITSSEETVESEECIAQDEDEVITEDFETSYES